MKPCGGNLMGMIQCWVCGREIGGIPALDAAIDLDSQLIMS